jgi:serine/threonine-protein kinase
MPIDDVLWSRWNEADALLARAQDVEPKARMSFVAAETKDDPELRALALRLLSRFDSEADRLAGPSGAVVESAFGRGARQEADAELAPGSLVDRYVVRQRRARGGMATVYEAERSDGAYRQRVALKVLRRGLDTDDVIRRFLTERQVLSSLAHPNIARLIDGGSLADGRPYLVMELVAGEQITEHADRHQLDIPARLDLFLQAANAVHAAHRQLVVHRDLKPSNILVDDTGTVKLLDFGIAKVLAGDAEHTQAGVRALTPGYASPEQIRGAAITTATDVFQLGLLLRELLTGVRPRVGGVLTPDLPASRLAISELPGAPPAEQRAAARATSVARLAARLRGDLDIVVARATRDEPDERYASADEMASDVRRHLQGLPITAHPESRVYRLRKLVRRNPWIAVTAGLATVALAGYALTITAQNRRIVAERDRAALETAKAEQVSDFLVRLFQSADPSEARGRQVTARELLDRGVGQVDNALAGEPEVRAALLSAIGQSYFQLGLHEEGRDVLARALQERQDALGRDHRDVAADLNRLAMVLAHTGVDSALGLFADALDVAERVAGREDPLVGRILTGYAVALGTAHPGDPRADSMLNRAVEILRNAPGDHRADLAEALTSAAYGKEPAIAIPLMREGLSLRRALYGDLHATTATSLSDLALAMEQVDPLAADSLMQRALDIVEQLHGRRHARSLIIMNNLAGLRRDRGAYAAAAPLYREVLMLRRELYPDEIRGHAFALYGLGLTLAEAGDPREAEGHLRAALRILREDSGSVLIPLAELAVGYSVGRQGRFTEAERLMTTAYRTLDLQTLAPQEVENALVRLIWLYDAWNRPQSGAPYRSRLDSMLQRRALSPGP